MLLLVLVLGLAFGYWRGYGDGRLGKRNVASQLVDRFGAAKVRAARDARDAREKEALSP